MTQPRKSYLIDTLLKSGASEDLILSDMTTFLGGFHTSAYYEEIKEQVGNDRNEKLRSYITEPNYYLRQVLDHTSLNQCVSYYC